MNADTIWNELQRAKDFIMPSWWSSEERQQHRDRIAKLEREFDEAAEYEFWDDLAHDELMGGVGPRVKVDCPF
jgi:hypothetical protein